MNAQNGGKRLSDWHVNKNSSVPLREGSLMTKMVPEGSLWSFGGLPEAVERNLDLPSPRSEQMIRTSPQTHIVKQEYFTPPRQPLMRGQHGTPITISSGGSYIQDEYDPTRASLKRAGSPSVIHGIPTKRQQVVYASSGMMHQPRLIEQDGRRFLIQEQVESLEDRYVDEQDRYQQQVPAHSQSVYRIGPLGRPIHVRQIQHNPQARSPILQQQLATQFSQSPYEHASETIFLHDNQVQHHSPHLKDMKVPPSYYSSPKAQLRALQHQSPQYRPAEPHPLTKMIMSDENGAYIRDSSQNSQAKPNNTAEKLAQRHLRQGETAGMHNRLQPQQEDHKRVYMGNMPRESPTGRAQQLQLGSPIWSNTGTGQKDALEVRVRGRNVVPAGSKPVPEDQIAGRQLSENPFTPPQQRARTPFVTSHRPSATQGGRSKSVVPASVTREVPQPSPQEEETLFQPDSVVKLSEDESESTPLNELFRRQQRQGQASRNNFKESSYNVVNALPQKSIFSHDRPEPAKSKPVISQGALDEAPQQSPEMVSIVSTPAGDEAASPPPTMRSIPMKDRIAPATKPPPKKSAATPKSVGRPKKSTPKTPKASKKQKAKNDAEPPPEPEVIIQQRAAELIITKEIQGAKEAMDLDLFGEILGLTEQEKAKEEDEVRNEQHRKLLAKTEELMAKEEAIELAEMERKRIAAEKEEEERLEKEKEEERAKAKRAIERKRQQALEDQVTDERRQKTVEQIEAKRKKAAEEAEERERKRREAKEKQEKVQADAEEIAKLKAKQEEARKQAASLTAAKISVPGEGEKAPANKENDGDAALEEESLFVPQTEPEATKLDDRSKFKPVGPSSAAQVFAQSAPKAAISGYRAEREEAELRREKLAKESRLNARWKRQEAAQALQQAPRANTEPVKERPGPSKAPKQDHQPPKSNARSAVSPPPSESGSSAESAVSQLIVPSFISSASSSFGSNKSAPASLFPNDSRDPNSKVKLISDLERQRIESEQVSKQANGYSLLKAKRTEQQKELRRKRDNEKARERYKQRVIDDANKLGMMLSEADVAADVEILMTRRENDRQRRIEREAAKKIGQGFPAGDLISQASPASQHRAFSAITESHTSTADEEELTLEEQLRRAKAEAMRAKVIAAAQQKNPSFARAAAKKTVADFQSDTESEEDPDPEPVPAAKTIESGESAQVLNSVESETDDDATSTVRGLNSDEQDGQILPPLPDMTASFESRNQSKRPQSKNSAIMGNYISTLANGEHQSVMLYIVRKELTFNGNDGNEVILGQWHSRKVANDFAAAKIQELRKRPTQSIAERFDDDGLYNATVVYDRGEKNQAYIYVTAELMSTGDIPEFDPSKVEWRLEERTYFVYQYLSQKKVDEETGEVHIHHNEPEVLGHYSRLDMANHAACARLLELTKPKTAKIDYIEQHTNIWGPKVRDVRDKYNEERTEFEAEIDKNDEQLQWVTFDTVRVEVRLFLMKGPRN